MKAFSRYAECWHKNDAAAAIKAERIERHDPFFSNADVIQGNEIGGHTVQTGMLTRKTIKVRSLAFPPDDKFSYLRIMADAIFYGHGLERGDDGFCLHSMSSESDFGGSGEVTSVYVMAMGMNGVFCFYPRSGSALPYIPAGMRAEDGLMMWDIGVCARSPNSCVRISNVNPLELTHEGHNRLFHEIQSANLAVESSIYPGEPRCINVYLTKACFDSMMGAGFVRSENGIDYIGKVPVLVTSAIRDNESLGHE